MPISPSNTYALLVGVEAYNAGESWNLSGPAHDVVRFVEYLHQQQIPASNIHTLVSPLATSVAEIDAALQGRVGSQNEATLSNIEQFITDRLSNIQADLLLVFWSGHGVVTSDGKRRLFTCDAEDLNRRNLDLDDLLLTLRTTTFAALKQQAFFIDTCANSVHNLQTSLPTSTLPRTAPQYSAEQFSLFAAALGQFALNLSAQRTGLFFDELLKVWNQEPEDVWPPDFEATAQALVQRFTDLRREGKTEQAPVVLQFRDWTGSSRNIGIIDDALESSGHIKIRGGMQASGADLTVQTQQISELSVQLEARDQTIAQLSQAVVNLSVPPAVLPSPASDVRWADNIERAERWSESVQISQIHAAQELIREVRQSSDFGSLSVGLRVRAATVAGKCAFVLDDSETAAREMDEALRLAPDEVRCLSNAAAAAFLKSDWPRALDLAQKALALQNDNLNAAMILVQVWAQTGETDKVEPFLQANAWFLESEWGLSTLSHVENYQGNFDLAYSYAKQALVKKTDHIAALDNLSDAVFQKFRRAVRAGANEFSEDEMARLDEAEVALTHAIDLLHNRPSPLQYHRFLCNRAALRNGREDYSGALDDCHLVLYGSPNAYNRDFATYTRGLISMKTGEYPKAIEDLEGITDAQLREESAMALAHCYQKVGNWDEASARLESLWHPENGDHGSFLVAEMLLQTHRARKDESAIAATLERLEAACPNSPSTLSIRAYDYFLRDNSEKAIETIQHALTLDGSDAERQGLFLRLGEIYYAANRYT